MVKEMLEVKAPGPDGFASDFFQSRWNIIGKDIWEAMEESKNSQTILKAFNATFLDLIPNEKEANTANKYRPKSLCNVVYKIISKIITYRLKPIL